MDITNMWQTVTTTGSEYITEWGMKLIAAIAVWVIGGFIVGALVKAFSKMLDKSKTDASLKPFLKSIIGVLLKVLLVITVMSTLGIEMTSFIAILGAAGLAVGMALSGTLQNFAGGVMILIFKPFKVGDFIDAQGHAGSVKEIQIFNTILKTPDNKTIIIPNGGLSNSSMVNYSTEPTRRVDFTFGIGYGDSIEQGKEVLLNILKSDPRVLSTPAEPFVEVTALADSSVNFAVRVWVNASDYWGVYFDTNAKVYNEFNKVGLNIPYPQMDVHVHKAN
ncbi:mechanosensitive ion channel family protein [Wenyingzhuangia sp. 2_MG-2023]|uniref:mechanosensitive ion channel family protein n=1 Tax=Wenyingzhuangia sp. 2_MG-2023 TaxID=3062639 RepID=UPI0026E2310D|nr:mechanosensitive ion channel domain-containing protein [Wenyingzhuangia sp. 2_MG-2023]MDO6736657.1 mechanosensitive ion channel [Wenyingzhuangia sp. 2_MG-2023]MDO6801048.1 mechanosensitive ion channel [Wenyingzhuangia sp. 1_MG-2023]